MNPLIPSAYDMAWTTLTFISLALVVATLVSFVRVSNNLMKTQSLIWTLRAILLAVLGPFAWFFIGRPAANQPSPQPALADQASWLLATLGRSQHSRRQKEGYPLPVIDT